MIESSTDILLIEDNVDDLELALRSLSRHHLTNRIRIARDGVEALDLLFHRNAFAIEPIRPLPLLIILDLRLPNIDGLEVLKIIKNDRQTQGVAVIVLTGSTSEADLHAATRLKADAFLEKPITFDKLCSVAKKIGLSFLLLSHEFSVPR